MVTKITKEYLEELNRKFTFTQIEHELAKNHGLEYGFSFTSNALNAKRLLKEYGIKKIKHFHNEKITDAIKDEIVQTINEVREKAVPLSNVYKELAKKYGVSTDSITRVYINRCGYDAYKAKQKKKSESVEADYDFDEYEKQSENKGIVGRLAEKTFYRNAPRAKKRIGFVPELPKHGHCKQYDDEYNLCTERIHNGSYCKKHAKQNYVGLKPLLVPKESRH